uniref:Uncharacterized protein n=1 Tax=Amblyomma tuberculatum TaxID=48802 RepID=A0A6M2E4X4_9ACAR
MRLNCCLSSRHILAASTLAPLSSLGSASMETTESRIFSTLCTGSALGTRLVAHGVLAWRVQDRDADTPICIDVGVVHLARKLHLGWTQRIVRRKGELGRENTAFETGTLRSRDEGFPLEEVLLTHRARDDAFGWVQSQLLVLGHQPAQRRPSHISACSVCPHEARATVTMLGIAGSVTGAWPYRVISEPRRSRFAPSTLSTSELWSVVAAAP